MDPLGYSRHIRSTPHPIPPYPPLRMYLSGSWHTSGMSAAGWKLSSTSPVVKCTSVAGANASGAKFNRGNFSWSSQPSPPPAPTATATATPLSSLSLHAISQTHVVAACSPEAFKQRRDYLAMQVEVRHCQRLFFGATSSSC